MYPHGGYKAHTVLQIGNVLAVFNEGRISLRGLRVYFAALTAVAARDAAKRSRRYGGRKPATPCYLKTELAGLCRCSAGAVGRELKALERAGLILFSPSEVVFTTTPLAGSQALIAELAGGRSELRPVPLPRPAVRFIAQCPRIATIKTMLAYCVRGLSLTRDGEVKGKGTAKAAWIAETCGISLRAVRVARSELIARGFITRDECSNQWKLNRHGAYFTVNMSFGAQLEGKATARSGLSSALPEAKTCLGSAPPYKDKKTPYGSENQKAHAEEQSGFRRTKASRTPKLSDVQAEDLRSVSRTGVLHAQAVRVGLARNSEAGKLAFFAAAIHAARVANRNAGGLFATIVRKGLWHFVTQEDEDRARRSLSRSQLKPQSSPQLLTDPERERRSQATDEKSHRGPETLNASPLLGCIMSRSWCSLSQLADAVSSEHLRSDVGSMNCR